jgi:hypothetical protein
MIVAVLHQFIKNNHDKIMGMRDFFRPMRESRHLDAVFAPARSRIVTFHISDLIKPQP